MRRPGAIGSRAPVAIAVTALAVLVIAPAASIAPPALDAQTRHRPALVDPARDLVRFELRLTTDARFASVRVLPDTLNTLQVQGRRLAGPADLRTAVLENLMVLSSNVEGSSATGVWRFLMANVDATTAVSWRMNVQAPHRLSIDIVNLNDEQQPRIVDHFDGVTGDLFTTNGAQLRLVGPLPLPAPPAARLVLGQYYPWYSRTTWADPGMVDQPLQLYSTDDAADVLADLKVAQHAGLDGVIVSFADIDGAGGWSDRGVRFVLQAAQQLGMQVSTQIETLQANTTGIEGAPPEVPVLVQWIDDIVDRYAPNPAYLHVNGRPVIFVYAWTAGVEQTWRAALERVRASGRNPFIVADTTDPAWLPLVDGEYTYNGNIFVPDIKTFTSRFALLTRTYHLFGAANGPQRLVAVTVSPGYDDRALRARATHLVADRENGAFYDGQWDAALHSGADWVVVTTWNEWWENTQIEPSQRYGDTYRWKTDTWAIRFKKSPRQ
jgi:hypothetical protein